MQTIFVYEAVAILSCLTPLVLLSWELCTVVSINYVVVKAYDVFVTKCGG